MSSATSTARGDSKKRVPIKEGFFTGQLSDLAQIRLQGSKCQRCGEVFLGIHQACQNCQGTELQTIGLGDRGKLYSYTILRNRPPGNYMGPEPFVPFAVGLIELPEGIRILAPMTGCDIDTLQVDTAVELVIDRLYNNEEGAEVIGFAFKPA